MTLTNDVQDVRAKDGDPTARAPKDYDTDDENRWCHRSLQAGGASKFFRRAARGSLAPIRGF